MEDMVNVGVPEAQCMGNSGYLLSNRCVIKMASALGFSAGTALSGAVELQRLHVGCRRSTTQVRCQTPHKECLVGLP